MQFSDCYLRQSLEEEVIYVNVDSYLKLIDKIDQDFNVSYKTTDQFIKVLNDEFKHRRIAFKQTDKLMFKAFTKSDGTIVIDLGTKFVLTDMKQFKV